MPRVALYLLPAREHEPPCPRPQPPPNRAERLRRLVEEHHTELADHHVERPLLAGPGLHVHLDETHVRTLRRGRPFPGQVQQRRRDVQPHNRPLVPHGGTQGHGQPTTTTPHVAHRLPRTSPDR